MYSMIIGDVVGTQYDAVKKTDKDFKVYIPENVKYSVVTLLLGAMAQSYDEGMGFRDSLLTLSEEDARLLPSYYRSWLQDPDPELLSVYDIYTFLPLLVSAFKTRLSDISYELDEHLSGFNHNLHLYKVLKSYLALIGTAKFCTPKKEEILTLYKSKGYQLKTVKFWRDAPVYSTNIDNCIMQSFSCFYYGNSYESSIRLACSIGARSNIISALTGLLAGCYYNDTVTLSNTRKIGKILPTSIKSSIL